MSRIAEIKSRLENAIISDLDKGIENVNCEELGAVIDMVKDLADAEYHCTIVREMTKNEEIGEVRARYIPEQYRDFERMYYTEMDEHDAWKGKSGDVRKHYFEVKDTGTTTDKMQHLENYAKALSEDITEMLQGISDNERTLLRAKMQTLVQKI